MNAGSIAGIGPWVYPLCEVVDEGAATYGQAKGPLFYAALSFMGICGTCIL